MLILAAVIAVAATLRSRRRLRSDRCALRSSEELIETIDVLLAVLRSGYSLRQSLTMLADVAPKRLRSEFEALRAAIDSGSSSAATIHIACSELDPHFRPLVGLLISALRLGTPTDSIIGQIRSEARLAHRQHSDMLARQLSVRVAVPLVLCTLPSFILLIIVPTVAGTLAHLQLNGDTP